MPEIREYYKIEKGTGNLLEEGKEEVFTEQEIYNKELQKKFLKGKDKFDNYIKGLGSYCFLFYDLLKDIEIASDVKMKFIFLTSYIKYNSGGMLVDTDKITHQIPLDRIKLKDKMQLEEKAFIRAINEMESSGLLYEKDNYYYINEKIIVKGKLIKNSNDNDYTRIFSDSIKDLYKNCPSRNHHLLYYFFAMLPFVSYKYNCVCYNPNENDLYQVKPMDIKDICEVIGYDKSKWKRLWTQLRFFKIGNESVITTIIKDHLTMLKINPKLYYAGNSKCLSELKQCFYEFYIND